MNRNLRAGGRSSGGGGGGMSLSSYSAPSPHTYSGNYALNHFGFGYRPEKANYFCCYYGKSENVECERRDDECIADAERRIQRTWMAIVLAIYLPMCCCVFGIVYCYMSDRKYCFKRFNIKQ